MYFDVISILRPAGARELSANVALFEPLCDGALSAHERFCAAAQVAKSWGAAMLAGFSAELASAHQ